MPEISPTRRRFLPLPFTAIQWTGTNQTVLDEVFGAGWEQTLIGHPLLVDNWLYRLDDAPEIYVMTDRVMRAFTEPAEEVSDVA